MSSSVASVASEEQRMVNFLLFAINNLFKLFNSYGLFYVFGSAAIKINNGIKLNTKSDIDTMLLSNGNAPFNYVIAAVIGRLFVIIDKINRRDTSYFPQPEIPIRPIIEISLKESEPAQIPFCNSIATILNDFGFSVAQQATISGPIKWQSTPLNISPFRIHVIYENDGRYLVKLVGAAPIGELILKTSNGPIQVPIYKEYLDINVYDNALSITNRQIEYSKIFLRSIVKVSQFDIPTASPGMILCQQIDLFHSRYLARSRGSKPREISADRKSEVRALWDSLSVDQKEAVRGLFARPVNTYTNVFNGKEKTVIGEFLKDIGLEGGKRRQTKGKKRRSTRKTL
jgi:hypothetical protein